MSLLVLFRGSGGGATTTVAPSTGHVVLTGYQPSVGATSGAIVPGTGHVLFSGKQPSVVLSRSINPSTGHAALTGKQPSVTLSRVIAPGAGHLVLTGKQPTIQRNIVVVPGTGHVLFSGKQPTLGLSRQIAPDTAHVLLTGKQPGFSQTSNQIVIPGTGRLVFSGHSPVVQHSVWPSPADVRFGVQYGPTGADYTGTLIEGTGETVFASRMTVTLTTDRLSVVEKPKKQAQSVRSAIQQVTRKQAQQSAEPKLTIDKIYVRTAMQSVQIMTQTDEWRIVMNKELI